MGAAIGVPKPARPFVEGYAYNLVPGAWWAGRGRPL